MPEITPVVPAPTIVNTPAPTVTPAPAPGAESVLFPTTPPPVTPEAAPAPVTPPVTPPVPEVKPPTETPKPGETPSPVPAPTEYDLKLPDGSKLTPEDLTQTLKDAKEMGLSKEQAERYLVSKDQTAKAVETRQQESFEKTKIEWKEAITKDPEMGGDKLAETTVLASRAFKAFSTPELQGWVEKTGLGNYPELVRFMARVGKMMGEDGFVRGTVTPQEQQRPPEEILYGKTTPK